MKDEIKTRHDNSNTYEIIKSTDIEVVDKGDGPHKKPVAIEKLIKWRNMGLSYSEIGSLAGVSKQSVHKRLKPFKEAIESLPTYKEHRADIFAILQSMLLNSLTESDIKAISAATRITAAAILYDKERIERGLNVSSGSSNRNNVQVYMDFTYKNKGKKDEKQM